MSTLNARPMQSDDIDSVYAIELVGHKAPWGRFIFNDCLTVGYDCRVLELQHPEQFEITSFIICRYYANIGHILNLCVAPVHQNKGHGRYILQNVIDSLAGSDINTLLLEVRPSNLAALHLYQRMGFQQIGIKKDYYQDSDSPEDAVVLQKNIF